MGIDFTNYQVPGVYTDEGSAPVVTSTGSNSTSVALVGPSRGYRIHTENIIADDANPVALTKLGIDPTTVVVSGLNGATYEGDTDYSIAAGAGEDSDILGLVDNTATLALLGGSAIADNQTLSVTYNYADASFYNAVSTSSYEDVLDYYGDPFDPTTGEIISPLSFAAKIAFENGALEVVLASTAGDATGVTRAQIQAAYVKLAALDTIDIVVPLPVGLSGTDGSAGDSINAATDLQAHVEAASAGGLYRVGVYGLALGSTINPATIAGTLASKRIVFAYPAKMTYYNSLLGSTLEVDGFYLAAAYAGRMAGQNDEIPLTNKSIRGFSGIPIDVVNTMTPSAKNTWSDAGVAVTEFTRQRVIVCRHGVTTNGTSVVTSEISVVRSQDAMIRLIEDSITSAGLIGQPIRENTVLQVKGIVQGALENARDSGLIVSYTNLFARLRPGSPQAQVIEVKFEERPSYPLNYIAVTFSIDTSSGEVDLSEGQS